MIEWVIDYAYCVILPNFRQPEIIFAMSLQRLSAFVENLAVFNWIATP